MRGELTKPGHGKGSFLAIAATGLAASAFAYWLRSRKTEEALTVNTRKRLAPKLKLVVPDPHPKA